MDTGLDPPETDPEVRAKASRSSSLLLRLIFSALIALTVSLAMVGLAVDRGYRAASMDALQERLNSTTFLLLSTLEISDEGHPMTSDRLAEPRLEQPGSGLYAGVLTPSGAWQSASMTGVLETPSVRSVPRGQTRFVEPGEGVAYFSLAMGLGWEKADGEIIDLTLWAAEDRGRYQAQIAAFRSDLWGWLGFAALLLAAVQSMILLLSLRPLRKVAAEVAEIEAGEREGLSPSYPTELQPLTANLNALLASERNSVAHYRRALSDLAHALKTPLAVLKVRLESGESVQTKTVEEELARMDRLIRRQLERAARSTQRTINKPVDVFPVLERLSQSLERLYRARPVTIQVSGDRALTLRIDERDLLELCGNLLDNAAKYGDGQMQVRLSAWAAGSRHPGVEIRIDDDGPGLDREVFSRLLERGARGDERAEGQGLGLAIARQLVEAYGGELLCESSTTLGGASVIVRFPPR